MRLRYLPNIITSLRVVLCISLIFIKPVLGTVSFIVYCIAGFTDMIDGPLARRIPHALTVRGGDFDAFADMLMIVIGVFVLIPAMNIWDWLWTAILVVLVFKILSASISGLIKHKRLLFTHTLANKLAALFLFITPILYFILGEHVFVDIYFIFLICWVFLATVEEALINFLLITPNVDVRGIWKVKEENERSTKDQ